MTYIFGWVKATEWGTDAEGIGFQIGRELEPRCAGSGGAGLGGRRWAGPKPQAFDPALGNRHEPGVQKTPDKEQQEGRGSVVFVLDGVNDGQSEIKPQGDLEVRHPSGAVAVELLAPRPGLAFDAEL